MSHSQKKLTILFLAEQIFNLLDKYLKSVVLNVLKKAREFQENDV